MGGGVDVGATGLLEGDPDCVADVAAVNLAVAHQPGEDRQPRGVCGRPAVVAEPRRAQVEAGRRAGVPALTVSADVVGGVHLEQVAPVALEHQHVAVGTVLDRRVGGNRRTPEVALVRIARDIDPDPSLAGTDGGVGDPVGTVAAEVGVDHLVAAQAGDPGDVVARPRIDGRLGDVLVPGALVRSRASRRGSLEGGEDRATADLRRRGRRRSGPKPQHEQHGAHGPQPQPPRLSVRPHARNYRRSSGLVLSLPTLAGPAPDLSAQFVRGGREDATGRGTAARGTAAASGRNGGAGAESGTGGHPSNPSSAHQHHDRRLRLLQGSPAPNTTSR